MYYKKTVCPYDCPASCGLLVETDGQKIFKTMGDPDHPLFHGLICNKMQHYEKSVNYEGRLLYPLKRTGKKGSGNFERVSWEEALKDITDRWKVILEKDGPDAFIGISSSGTLGIIQKNCVEALFNKIGGRKLLHTLCSGAKEAGFDACTGGKGSLCPSEMKDSDYYLIWGSNLKATRIHTLNLLSAERKKGKKIVLIDVCSLDNEKYCDETILIKPGTDGALALAMMHVLYKEGYTDNQKNNEFFYGYEEFVNTLYRYSPEWAEKVTGISADTIIRISREFGKAAAPVILHGNGNTRRKNGGMTTRLIAILSAFTGKWGISGAGYVGRNPKPGRCVDSTLISRPDFRTHDGITENICLLADVLANDDNNKTPVKAVYFSGSNAVNSIHNQKKMKEALSSPEIFTVVHERIMTDTAIYADYILPATFNVECNDCHAAYGYCNFGTALQIIPPPGECKSNWDTICLLAEYMGFDDEYFKKTDLEMLELLLNNPLYPFDSISNDQMKILKEGGCVQLPYADHLKFDTPSGRFLIKNESLEEAMPAYSEDFNDPYPLSLVAIPNIYTLNSVFFGRPDLLEKRGQERLIINTDDARERDINDGEIVKVFNDLSAIFIKALVTDRISKGCVAVSGVYDSSMSIGDNNLNSLHHSRVSDIGSGTTLNGNHVEITKLI